MKDRIILLIKAKNLTAAQFADEIGVQKSSISHIISGRNNASLDFVQKILLRYPEVNMNWILFGKGSIFKEGEITYSSFENKHLKESTSSELPPVDLFSALNTDQGRDFRQENTLNIEQAEDNNGNESAPVSSSIGETHPAEIEPKTVAIAKTPEIAQRIPERNATKSIIKIVEFYSDNTFKEFFPV